MSLLLRIVRAARLDGGLYAEVRDDPAATGQAAVVVALVGFAHGVSTLVRAALLGWGFGPAFVIAIMVEVSLWVVASLVIYLVGRHLFGSTASYGQVLRLLGFATAPGLFILVVSLLSGRAAELPALAIVATWRLAASLVAVRQALRLNTTRSAVTLGAGVAAGSVVVVAVASALFRALAVD